jgi:hypothetical protein
VLLHEAVLELRPQGDDAGEIDLVEGGQVRRFLLRAEEPRGDFLAQGRHPFARSPFAGGPGRGGGSRRLGLGCAFGAGEHVALEDASVLAGAGDGGGIDPLFLGLITDGGGKIVRIFAPGRCGGGNGGFHAGGFLFRAIGGFLLTALRRSWRDCFFVNGGDNLADLHRVADLDQMLELARAFGHDFGGDLVGLDFEDRFAGLDVSAVRLAPDAENARGDRFSDGRDFDFDGHKKKLELRT